MTLLPGFEGEMRKRDLSQFYTPPELSEFLWRWSVTGPINAVLEPSFGRGALMLPMFGDGIRPNLIRGVEADPGNFRRVKDVVDGMPNKLRGRPERMPPHTRLVCGDFLEVEPHPVDLALQNPPYENGMEVAFIERSLDWAPRTCGIFRAALVFGQKRTGRLWRWHDIVRGVRLSERPDFGGEYGAKTDFLVLEIVRRESPRQQGEVSVERWSWR